MDHKIVISADSVCDIPKALIEKYDFTIMPLLVGLGEQYFQDGVDITPDDIYKYVAESKTLPKTAARSIADYMDFFTRLSEGGREVIHFTISADMSSSYQNACIAASEVGDNVHIVDSRNLSTGIALLMLDAAQAREEGQSTAEILALLEKNIPLVRASFVVDTLDYLRMGGRCSAVAALGANMLKLHPCIEVKNGKMGVGTKYRGPINKVVLQYAAEKLKTSGIRTKNIFVTHTAYDEQAVAKVVEMVKEMGVFENIYECEAGSTINSHCGAGTLGVLFEVDE